MLNEKLVGVPVAEITPGFIQNLAASLGELAVLLSSALLAVLDVARDSMEAGVRLNGQMNLLFYPEFSDGEARKILGFLESRQELARLLFHTLPSVSRGGVQVFIGHESHRPELSGSSLLVAHYLVDGQEGRGYRRAGPHPYAVWKADSQFGLSFHPCWGRCSRSCSGRREPLEPYGQEGEVPYIHKQRNGKGGRILSKKEMKSKEHEKEEKKKTDSPEQETTPAQEADGKELQAQVADLQAKLAEAEKQQAETKDQLLRVLAEYDNYRKRTEREKAATYDNAAKDTIAQFLGCGGYHRNGPGPKGLQDGRSAQRRGND